MSESHIQVNLDGTTAIRKTALWPSSKKEQEPIVRSIFEHNNWKVSEINHQAGSFWKVITTCNGKNLKINLYISSVRDEDRQPDEFKMQLGTTYPKYEEKGWITLVLGIYTIAEGYNNPIYILSGYDRSRYDFSTNPSIRGTRTAGLQKALTLGMFKTERSILFRPEFIYYYIENTESLFGNNVKQASSEIVKASMPTTKQLCDYLTAIRTKPFLLLAGISGTGKSRIVRELAFKSCPEYLQDKGGTTPGNYCMIEVKPNWHDSTELLGYYSNMNKSYQFKKFVKFLIKAKMNPEVPFFICLDEMNLAPVEHYFAEMLSIMETRKHPKKEGSDEVDKDVIRTGVVVESQYFKEWTWTDENSATHTKTNMSDMDWYKAFFDVVNDSEEDLQIRKYQYERTLLEEGLTLPDNVIIIGTVNMDDTTHQFSRKVIDRAMTIEMNGGKLSNMFGGSKDLEYLPREEQEKWQKCFRQLYVNADEVLEAHPNEAEDIVRKVPEKLEDINKALKGTPFEVSYRVLNELTIMVGVLLDSKKEGENIDDIINQALDRILLMKILPRIEGDSDMFNLSRDFKQKNNVEYNNRLEWLMALAPEIVSEEQEGDDHRQTAREKIQEMIDRLENQEFTRFWP